ncbi:MAG: hypothetical protein AUK47_07440 [Deltaproteobacteria bacterium CG2_30_63_29]|nr:MAG: hypothetical protein AUK47_07440 [Deltaproteobacteria bacterium CG2_30_63_29]PIW00702.1 MAG: hypothetical protein COW42_07005 [Deltaproteobacteria bacterium CG17_big_fil_post_rev_8_21_14_2_50_63_7]
MEPARESIVRHFELHLERLKGILGLATEEDETSRPLAEIERDLSRLEAECSSNGTLLPLIAMAKRFGLTEPECDVLVLATAPGLNPRWRGYAEQATRYGKLDVAFAVEALEKQGVGLYDALALFEQNASLRLHRLIQVFTLGRAEESQLLSHRLQTPMRVAHALVGREVLDENISDFTKLQHPTGSVDSIVLIKGQGEAVLKQVRQWCMEHDFPAGAGRGRALMVHLRGGPGVGKTSLARAIASELGLPLLEVDSALLQSLPQHLAASSVEELFSSASFLGALLCFESVDLLASGGAAQSRLRRASEEFSIPVILIGEAELAESSGLVWRSQIEARLAAPEVDEREAIWKRVLEHRKVTSDVEPGLLANQFSLTGAQIVNATEDAHLRSAAPLTQDLLTESSSYQLRADLSQFAKPRSTKLTLDDLVLPPSEKDSIKEIVAACGQRAKVLHHLGFRKRLDYGTGIVSLFSGDPGTGKTLAARIIAEAVNMSLYQIAIPSIVSKWIGETERNISQIFQRARASQAILLFDEADSLLATRTEVKDATDRYANMSTNQLLQEIEAYEGIIILTTNFEQNLDSAAERRILFRVHFPYPGVEERAELWSRLLPEEARPKDSPIDFESLAEYYELSGGHIKNAILRAAYSAMDQGSAIDTDMLAAAAEKECRAIGKLVRRGW